MTVQVGQFVRFIVNGNDRSEYVISYTRHDDICELGSTFNIDLSPEYPVSLDPYDNVLIREYYDGNLGSVLRGYILKVSQEFDPGNFTAQGMDKSSRLHDYFIDQQLESNGELVDYWINYIAGLAGLSVTFQATSTAVVPEGDAMGLQSAADAILKLERLAAYYIKYDSSLDSIVVFRLGSSEPVINIETTDSIVMERTTGTENTRNVVKIYGGFRFNPITEQSNQIFSSARKEMPELITDKVSVIANPHVNSNTFANIIATRILDIVSTIDDAQLYQLAGFYPAIQVGQSAYINVNFKNIQYEGNRIITSIEAAVNTDGVLTTLGFGAKCPRISIAPPVPPILVTDTEDGVGISWDGGESFVPSNVGLPLGSGRYGLSISANNYSQQLVITAAGVYRRSGTGGVWGAIPAMPDPVNNANDAPAPLITDLDLVKVVAEPTNINIFHILARRPLLYLVSGWRSWVYTTKNFGNTWDSFQFYITQEPNILVPSGISYSAYAADISVSQMNRVSVLVNGGTPPPKERRFYGIDGDVNLGYFQSGVEFTTIKDISIDTVNETLIRNTLVSSRYNRNTAWAFQVSKSNTNDYFIIRIYKTTNGGIVWNKIYDNWLTGIAWVDFTVYSDDPNHMPPSKFTTAPIVPYKLLTQARTQYKATIPILFDYANSIYGDGSWYIPVYSSRYENTYSAGNPTAPFTMTQYFYRGGYEFLDPGNGNIQLSYFPPVEILKKTWVVTPDFLPFQYRAWYGYYDIQGFSPTNPLIRYDNSFEMKLVWKPTYKENLISHVFTQVTWESPVQSNIPIEVAVYNSYDGINNNILAYTFLPTEPGWSADAVGQFAQNLAYDQGVFYIPTYNAGRNMGATFFDGGFSTVNSFFVDITTTPDIIDLGGEI